MTMDSWIRAQYLKLNRGLIFVPLFVSREFEVVCRSDRQSRTGLIFWYLWCWKDLKFASFILVGNL